jgi:glycerol-3-phosphate dehydrogenase
MDSGLLSLMGGKWTIYRRMGEDLLNIIAKKEE